MKLHSFKRLIREELRKIIKEGYTTAPSKPKISPTTKPGTPEKPKKRRPLTPPKTAPQTNPKAKIKEDCGCNGNNKIEENEKTLTTKIAKRFLSKKK